MWFVFERYENVVGAVDGPFNTAQEARAQAEKRAQRSPQIVYLLVQAVEEVYSVPTLKFKKLG